MPSADWKVELVDDQGEADYTVTVVGQQVIDMTGASPGDVLTVQPDGLTVEPDPPAGAAGAAGGVLSGTYPNPGFAVDMATQAELDAKVAQTITNGVTASAPSQDAVFDALALKAPLASPTFTGTVTMAALVAGGGAAATQFVVDTSGRVGQGAAANTAIMYLLLNGAAHPGSGSTLTGFASRPLYPSNATAEIRNFESAVATAAASFTLAVGYGFKASVPTIGAGSTITTLIGFRADNQGATGVTNAYGVSVVAQSGAATLNVGVRIDGGTQAGLWLNSDTGTAAGGIVFGASRDTPMFRAAAGKVCVGSLAVSNAAAATVAVGTLANKIEVFNGSGVSLGFVPVYATIT